MKSVFLNRKRFFFDILLDEVYLYDRVNKELNVFDGLGADVLHFLSLEPVELPLLKSYIDSAFESQRGVH